MTTNETRQLIEFYRGRTSAFEDARNTARTKSGEAFAQQEDALAKWWRDVANWLSQEQAKSELRQRTAENSLASMTGPGSFGDE